MIRVTSHAIIRYQERVANVSLEQARETLRALAQAAAEFGAPIVRLGTGQRIVIKDHTVVTVLPAGHFPGSFDPRRNR